jgi:hypothetical protein
VVAWLERNTRELMDKLDAGEFKKEINDVAKKRQTRYVGTPRNVYRHVIISDIKVSMEKLKGNGNAKH